MSLIYPQLGPKAQRGSKPRCHILTDGTRAQVAARLSALTGNTAIVAPTDVWLPEGFVNLKEAELDKAAEFDAVISACHRAALRAWWLGSPSIPAQTPTWDIASTCTIDGRPGMLLVEAKAHDNEFLAELKGRSLGNTAAARIARFPSHLTIGRAISDASAHLQLNSNHPIALSRDHAYQLSNRFAWSWKLAELGIPVVLVYLGFLNANDVLGSLQPKLARLGTPFPTSDAWTSLVKTRAAHIVAPKVWGSTIDIHGTPFIPMLATL